MTTVSLWHNPRCSKSRNALRLLEEAGHGVTVRRYLEDVPTQQELRTVQKALGVRAIDMMRPAEAVFRDAGLSRTDDEDVLVAAMATHPILIERPIALVGERAVIGRPPTRVLELV